MEIKLGKPVVSLDGARLGTVDRLVVDPRSWELDEVIIHRGVWFGEDRIVERSFIDHVDRDGTVHLGIVAAEASRLLPSFVVEAYRVPSPDAQTRMPASFSTGGGDPSAILWRTVPRGEGYERLPRPLFETPVTTEPQIEVRSNLLNQDVVVTHGTKVLGSDGRQLGAVEEVEYSNGKINSLSVKAGLFSHDVVILPIEMVESVAPDRVRLTVSAADAMRATRRDAPVAVETRRSRRKDGPMVDHEQVLQQRDISGDTVLVCDRCGQAIDPATAHLVEPEPADLAQPGSETWLCPECWQALESGQEGLEPQVELNEPFEPA